MANTGELEIVGGPSSVQLESALLTVSNGQWVMTLTARLARAAEPQS